MQDVTARKETERKLAYLANHDPLTGLANRALFNTKLQEALKVAGRDETGVVLLIIDLDGFKEVNDTLGHDAGDAILFEVAQRIAASVPENGLVARLGGDEFAVVVSGSIGIEQAVAIAECISMRVREPFAYEELNLSPRVSMGIAAYPEHDSTGSELLKDADLALYKAKSEGRSRVEVYDPVLRQETEQRVNIINDVRRAAERKRIRPFYQPKLCLTSGKVIGLEALARWLHPTRGVLTPNHFASAFEDREVSRLIGREMVRAATEDMREWLNQGLAFGTVAVNFSPSEFADTALSDWLLSSLAGAGLSPSTFEVEVTETVFLGPKSGAVAATLDTLRDAGVRIALDDFGTGFSSLSHLRQFPVDHIKIDQSFIRDLEDDAEDAAIVRAVIGLGRSLDLLVTAEGVETVGQVNWLRENGCQHAQGYYFSKPVAASRVPWFVNHWNADELSGPQRTSLVS